VTSSPAPRAPLPPIARELVWSEWLLVAAVWLVIALLPVGMLTENARRAGIGVGFRDYLTIQIIDWVVWLALLWPLFVILDATPLTPAKKIQNGVIRVAAWFGIAAVHAAISYIVLLVLVGSLDLSPAIWQTRPATPFGTLRYDLINAIVPFTGYAILRRSHRRRLEVARADALERSLLRARLHALDLELRPHFLFNTLNAITALVRSQPAQAERMLITLGDLLRVTLGRTGQEVTVSEELQQLELYLDIQRVRFRDRLDVRIEADADVMSAYVPGMILQPLVENAITHGLAPKTGPGTVRVSVHHDSESVVLRVADDGVGLPSEGMRERTGVGNTRARLRALYGEAHSVTLTSPPTGGTVAEVRLPLRDAPTRTAEFPIPSALQPSAVTPSRGARSARAS
jgi:two-component system LytT family sensor kinase